jgi:hypothetical protein
MMPESILDVTLERQLCKNCFNCKIKGNKVYCKFGLFEEKKDTVLLYIPQDFDCPEYEEV